MNTMTVQRLRSLSALTLAVVALAVVSPPMASRAAAIHHTGGTHSAIVRLLAGSSAEISGIQQATNEYRQFYDSRYAAAARFATATNEYYQFYDPR